MSNLTGMVLQAMIRLVVLGCEGRWMREDGRGKREEEEKLLVEQKGPEVENLENRLGTSN
jgi:hypothetical protein